MDDFDAPPEIVDAPLEQDDWALGGSEAYTVGAPKPPWLLQKPPKKRPFVWPSGGKSPSWFKRLALCQLQHAERYRRKQPDATGIDGVIGNVIHGAIEDALNIRTNPGRRGQIPFMIRQDELLFLAERQVGAIRQDLDVIEGAAAGMIVTTEVLSRCRQIIAGLKPIDARNIWIDPKTGKSGVEYIWQFHLGYGLLIAGIADLITAQPDPTNPFGPPLQVTIIDWKTGYNQLPSPEELELDAQACLELCWARRAFPNTPTIKFKIVNVTLSEEVAIEWNPGLDQLTTSFARACWHLWQSGDETPSVGSHCAYCAYRSTCTPYSKHLQQAAYTATEGLEALSVPELVRAFRQSKVLMDMAEQRKKDSGKLLMKALGKQSSYQTGSLLARKKRRTLKGWKNEHELLTALAALNESDPSALVNSCTKLNSDGVEGFVKTLPLAKQIKARELIEAHSNPRYTPWWIEVSNKEAVI